MRLRSARKNNVVFVSEVFPPRIGGDGIHVMELALHLSRSGIGVSVLTKSGGGTGRFPFEVRRVGLARNDLLGRLSFVVGAMFERSLIREADVIHAHAAVGGVIGLFYKLLYKKPVVVTVHTIWGGSLSATRAKWIGAALERAEKGIFMSGFDRCITVTREIADKLQEWGLRRVSFVPNGVNTGKFRPPGNKARLKRRMGFGDNAVLLFVGRLVKQKNVGLLLESFRAFHDKNPGSRLLIAGSGPEEGVLKEMAGSLALGDCVRFLGPIGYEKLPPYYQISDCLVITSRWEGLPLCALEALATGIPVVGTAVGGLPEVIVDGRNGFLVEGRPENISAAIARAIALDPKQVETYSKKAVKPYAWETIAKKVNRVYAGL